METFKNCKEVKEIMVMIIDYDYDFLSDVIFEQQLKITFKKSSAPTPLKKSTPPFLPPPLKIQKVQVHRFLLTLKIFLDPLQKGGKDTVNIYIPDIKHTNLHKHQQIKGILAKLVMT